MADTEFTVVLPRRKRGPMAEYVNAVVMPDGDDQPEGAIYIESYEYGCEGFGHFLGTTLKPGRYKIVKIDD